MNDGAGNSTKAPAGTRLGLLDGLKILDLTRFLAGPFAGMLFADLGADVIKVEQITGDSTRTQPPYFFEGDSAYFMAINRNKRSIAVDIKTPEGYRIIQQLIAESDIVLDNLRQPQRQALGLSYEDLAAINPRIISCSVTGFGSDGPYEDRPAYDIIVEAMAGIMSLTGPEGGPSVRAGVPIGDLTAGLYAVIAVLAAVQERHKTGRGRHLDIGMLDCQVALLSYLAQYYFVGGVVPSQQGRAHLSIPTYNCFACEDGREVVIAANTQEMWVSLCTVLGRADLADDARYATRALRLEHRVPLVETLTDEFSKWRLEDIYDALVAAEVPVAPINALDRALKDPQVRHRHMVVDVEHRSGQHFETLGIPIAVDGDDGAPFLSPPGLGEHTRDVLQSLGYDEATIATLAAEQLIVTED
jgi:CoA:oxalate CoA-transferase